MKDPVVQRAFEVVEETPEAAVRREELFGVLLRHNPRLLSSLLSDTEPRAEGLTERFADKELGRFFRALLVALEYLGWSRNGPIPDLDEDDLGLIDACLKDGVTRLLTSNHYYQRMFARAPEFVNEFYFLLTQSMFMDEMLRDLTLIIVGRLWEKKEALDAPNRILVVIDLY